MSGLQPTWLTGANIEDAGEHNERIILYAIRANGPIARSDLSDITGLTAATVTNITNRLLESGLVKRAERRRGGRGKPATRLVINSDGAFSIGINIDRDHLTMVAADFSGTVRARVGREMAFPLPEDVRDFFRAELDVLLKQAEIPAEAVIGIGIAMPDDLGTLDVPMLPSGYDQWSTVRLDDLLSEPLGIPVMLENDAAAAAIGEIQFGLGQQHRDFFYLLITYALGGGVVTDAIYNRGVDGRSGEIGFMRVDDGENGLVSLNDFASLAGLSRLLEAAGLTDSPRAPDMNDPAVVRVVDAWIARSAAMLAGPLDAVNCLLNPGAILIGGRLPTALAGRLATAVERALHTGDRFAPRIAPVMLATLAEDAAAVGAALLPFRQHFMPPNRRSSAIATGGGSGSGAGERSIDKSGQV